MPVTLMMPEAALIVDIHRQVVAIRTRNPSRYRCRKSGAD